MSPVTISTAASFVIQSQEDVRITLKGYNQLQENTLFHGELAAGTGFEINTEYVGLALLVFEQGQAYPVVIGEKSFILKSDNPELLPHFVNSEENEYFYRLLSGTEEEDGQYTFVDLMIEAKQILNSTGFIRTVEELQAMKERMHSFVRTHYRGLQHSDTLRRLLAQYFMMHEYVDYHILESSATVIQVRYQNALINGVESWLDLLSPNLPTHEILNYCVALYYDRGMVSLAFKIMQAFTQSALCPGREDLHPHFPTDLTVINANGKQSTWQELRAKKTVVFVSSECPVSMVEAVVQARHLARRSDEPMVIVPLESLSPDHFAIHRQVDGGNIMFVDDEKWRIENLSQQMPPPRTVKLEGY